MSIERSNDGVVEDASDGWSEEREMPEPSVTRKGERERQIPESRVGLGIDFHRLVAGRRLVIGGLEIPNARGLAGHSDADVLIHAMCDSLLGAAGRGDIGTHFPDNDPRYRDISSLLLLEHVLRLLADDGWRVVNVDATVVAQEPKLTRHFDSMKAVLGGVLDLPPDRIGLKATTSEGMGAMGRGEGISALCVCLIERAPR